METGSLTGHMGKLLPVLLSISMPSNLVLYCCLKQYPKATWEKEVFAWLVGYGELSRESKAGTEVEMKCLASLRLMFSCLSYTAQAFLPGDGTANGVLLHKLAIKKMLPRHAHRPISWRQFLH